MDNRLIFLYHLDTLYDAVTQKDRQSGLMVEPVQALRVQRSEVRAVKARGVMGTENKYGSC